MESINMNKWMYGDNGLMFPISGQFKLFPTPGPGIFNLEKSPNPMDGRLGLRKVAEKFEFPFKIYDLGGKDFLDKIKATWYSPYFEKMGQNLGVCLNGTKGCGKTILAKILCNELDIPVINVSQCLPGILEFISSLEFECIILLDEAEKTFRQNDAESSQILLKLIDGVMNKSRKLYVLTTNTLDINQNLIGRPGRIRYIKTFGNLDIGAIEEYLKDNLINKDAKEEVMSLVEAQEISTIDTLKAIVDEVNIHGHIADNNNLNLQLKQITIPALIFNFNTGQSKVIKELEEKRFKAAKEFMRKWSRKDKPITWAFLTRFDKDEMDPNWVPGEDEFVDPDSKRDEKREIINLEKDIIGFLDDETPVDKYEKKDSKQEIPFYVEDYLAQKFHLYKGEVYVQGNKLLEGMVTCNMGKIIKKDKDGWFYSESPHRNDEFRFLIQDNKGSR